MPSVPPAGSPAPPHDGLSPLCHTILSAQAGHAYGRLVVPALAAPPEAERLLARVKPEQLLTEPVESPEDAEAMLAGLWLWHDALDRSHTISQALKGETGSFWHAIMHRREGDFDNARYWYARCRHHPALARIPAEAAAEVEHKPELLAFDRVVRGGSWDGSAFVDRVEDVYQDESDPRFSAVVRLQRIEWRVLFEHCALAATGRGA
jgi:hypothetical protein